MKPFCTVALALCCLSVYGQDVIDTGVVRRIREEAFARSQVMDIAFHLTDASGPRLSNSPGLFRAQRWVATPLQGWGLSNVAREPWGTFGKGWEVTKDYLAMTEPYYQPLIAYPLAWTRGSGGPFTTEVVLYHPKDSTEQAAYKGKLRGKFIMFPNTGTYRWPFQPEAKRYTDSELAVMATPPPPPVPDRRPVIDPPARRPPVARPRRQGPGINLSEEGMLGILTASQQDRDGTVVVQSGGSQRWDDSLAPLRLQMSSEQLHQIQRLLEAGIRVTVEGDIETHSVRQDSVGYNVVGEIPGTDLKDQLVIIGGHLDSWASATGATDNGAGSAVMMEVIRILTALHLPLRRTVRIVLWSGEEQGLLGSNAYVRAHFKKDSIAASRVSAYYNLDNGSGKIRGVYLQEDTAARQVFQRWLEPFKDLGATTVTHENTGGTDHLPFVDVGIPGFQFIQDPLQYYDRTHHSNMDTYDHLSPEDLKQAAAVIAAFVYQTAIRNEMIPRRGH
jgi:hypothetical protein